MGGVILVASVIVWFLSYYPRPKASYERELTPHEQMEQQSNSYLGKIGQTVTPLVEPLGFNWKVTTSLLSGSSQRIGGKHTRCIISLVAMPTEPYLCLKNITASILLRQFPDFTPLVALSFMVFVLLYFPCIASVIAVAKEAGSWKWGAFTVLYNTGVAWIVSFLVYQIGLLII